jgi:hypothetical protein
MDNRGEGGGGNVSTASDYLHIFKNLQKSKIILCIIVSFIILCVAKPIKRVNESQEYNFERFLIFKLRIWFLIH